MQPTIQITWCLKAHQKALLLSHSHLQSEVFYLYIQVRDEKGFGWISRQNPSIIKNNDWN